MKSQKSFEVVRASAGSGKTYRLVSRYLACCLAVDDPRAFRHVLALTFTNKAAWEMKERILSDLAKVGSGTAASEFLIELTDQTRLSLDTLASRARALRAAMLHRYGEISVMTLDSFTNRLVKSFARDLALDQDYRIELDQDRIVDEAVSNLLDRIGSPGEEALTAMLKGFARLQVEEEKDSRIRHPLVTFGKEVQKESMRNALEALADMKPEDFSAMSKSIRSEVKKEEKELAARVKLAQEAVAREGLTKKDVSRGLLLSWFEKNIHGEAVAPTPMLQNMFDEGIFTTKSASAHLVGSVSRIIPDAEHVLEQVQHMTPGTSRGEAHLLRKRILHKVDLVGTLAMIAEEMEHVQEVRNVRTFHALHERVARVVRHNPVPFLFERMGSRYRHVFVDEFQDTSVTQWQNLIPLVDHVLSERHRTLVVGDGKQAIYRWRNGDYRQLLNLPVIVDDDDGAFVDAERTFHDALDDQVLEFNWRSGEAIVNWNNEFFAAVQRRLPKSLQAVYDKQAQSPKQEFQGHVHIEAVHDEDKDIREELLNHACVERLRHYSSKIGGEFKWSEMAVLVRTNKQGARIAQHMLNEGITPQTEDSLHVGRHPAALAVVALTRWVLEPNEDRHAAAWLQCVSALEPQRIKEAEVLDRHVTWKEVIIDGRTRRFQTFHVEAMMDELYPKLCPLQHAHAPLVTWVGHACDVLGVTGRFDAYAEALMELAREVTGTHEGGLRGFLHSWDRVGHARSIVASGGRDAVQVMTVHKAKGLAFPVTIVVAGDNKAREVKGPVPVVLDPSTGTDLPAALLRVSDMKDTALNDFAESELDAALLDQVNIIYVAMTRPIERLDVIAETAKLDFDRANPTSISQWVLSCAEDVSNKHFANHGDCLDRGVADRLDSGKGNDDGGPSLVTTRLNLGEQAAQRVVMARPQFSEVHPDGLVEAELGTLVHELLAEVQTIEDWPQVRARFASRWSLEPEDRKRVLSWADSVFSEAESAAFFEVGVKAECEPDWMDEHGPMRPDRVLRKRDGWHVVDFKSGDVNVEKHAKQVRRYMNALADLEVTTPRGWILYLNPWRLIEVPEKAAPRILDPV